MTYKIAIKHPNGHCTSFINTTKSSKKRKTRRKKERNLSIYMLTCCRNSSTLETANSYSNKGNRRNEIGN